MLSITLILSGCSPRERISNVSKSGSVIYIRGVITESTRNEVLNNSGEGLSLVIRSPGGSTDAALDIAEFVRINRIPVTVDGLCASACAQYVVAASPHRTINDDGILIFHTSPFTWKEILDHQNAEHQTYAAANNERINRIQKLYSLVGIDVSILHCIDHNIDPIEGTFDVKSGRPPQVKTKYAGIYLDRPLLEKFGYTTLSRPTEPLPIDGGTGVFELDGSIYKHISIPIC